MGLRKTYCHAEVVELLRERVKEAGCQKFVAKKLKISPQFLSDILKGRRVVSDKLAKQMGLWRFTYYVQEP